MADKTLSGAGLRGQVAGQTRLCTVGLTGSGLTYLGYDITELAEQSTFEEVAHLLIYGHLPTSSDLLAYKNRLQSMRGIPELLKDVLERIPADAHPMDVMRTGCSMLGNLETESDFSMQFDAIDRMIALFPSIICYWYHFSHEGIRIETETDDNSVAAHFLHLLTGDVPNEIHQRCMDVSLILYAEHEFNASTFAARVCASTLTDIHSCVTAAISCLRGPLHGGANEAAMAMIKDWQTPEQAEQEILAKLSRKEMIMGFGHAVYRTSDPRNALIKVWSEKLAIDIGDTRLYQISCKVEEVMWREKKLFCNADFFHATAYHFMDIPTKLFTPIFVMSRVTGWTAHVIEQRADNRLIRPSAGYIGPEARPYLKMQDRIN